eukprot:7384005-Prymnesium_polylepis.1
MLVTAKLFAPYELLTAVPAKCPSSKLTAELRFDEMMERKLIERLGRCTVSSVNARSRRSTAAMRRWICSSPN